MTSSPSEGKNARQRERYWNEPGVRERHLEKTRSPERLARLRQEYKTSAERRAQVRRSFLKTKYGISVENWRWLLAFQGGKCAICRGDFEETPHVDHDHVSGWVRGLLCTRCNTGLGQFEDDPERLVRAARYLSVVSGGQGSARA